MQCNQHRIHQHDPYYEASGSGSEVGLQLGLARDLADHLLAEEGKTKEEKEKECFICL